jgi:hypothetical protein
MAQTDKIGKTATNAILDNITGEITVRYHSTDVVKVRGGIITLDSGGWRTNTTKTRMNQASNAFSLGFKVHQKDFDWYVTYNGQDMNYFDGIQLIP